MLANALHDEVLTSQFRNRIDWVLYPKLSSRSHERLANKTSRSLNLSLYTCAIVGLILHAHVSVSPAYRCYNLSLRSSLNTLSSNFRMSLFVCSAKLSVRMV